MGSSGPTDGEAGVRALEPALDRFRSLRRQLEASVLPLATSVDGRRFSYQASLHDLQHRLGGYVVLEQDGAERLGQPGGDRRLAGAVDPLERDEHRPGTVYEPGSADSDDEASTVIGRARL